MRNKSEYLAKYGFDIPYTDYMLDIIGVDVEITGKNDEVLKTGIATGVRFGDSVIERKGVRYLSFQVGIGNYWSQDFPSDVKEPPIYDEYEKKLVERSMKSIKYGQE